jgi:hypothetical protein
MSGNTLRVGGQAEDGARTLMTDFAQKTPEYEFSPVEILPFLLQ